MTAGGLPHSDTLGSKPCRHPSQDYRPHTSFIGTVRQGIHHTPITTTTTRPPRLKALLKNPRTTSDHGDAPTRHAAPIRLRTGKKNTSDPNPHSLSTSPHPNGGCDAQSTIQFSNHHPTRTLPPAPTGTGQPTWGTHWQQPPHPGRWRPGNPTARTTTINTTLPRQQARAATTNHRTRQTPATK